MKRILFPRPICPECRSEMRLVEPRADDGWDAFWGCPRYPKCRGSRNIDPDTGKPETDFEIDERRRDYEDTGENDDWGDRD